MVASIVVVPLLAGGGAPLGALYFTLAAPCEFANLQDTLLVRWEMGRLVRGRTNATHHARRGWARFAGRWRRRASGPHARHAAGARAAPVAATHMPGRTTWACAPATCIASVRSARSPSFCARRCTPDGGRPYPCLPQGFIGGVTPLLHTKLAGRSDVLAAMVAKVGLA